MNSDSRTSYFSDQQMTNAAASHGQVQGFYAQPLIQHTAQQYQPIAIVPQYSSSHSSNYATSHNLKKRPREGM